MGNAEGGPVCELKEIDSFLTCVSDTHRTSTNGTSVGKPTNDW